MLKGNLTYLVAVSAIAWGVIGFAMGWADQTTAINAVWMGLATFGIRRAIG